MVSTLVPNDSLRVKVVNACNLKCGFCHGEGGGHSDRLTPQQLDEIIKFAQGNGFGKIHFTGGEPTLHNQIVELVRLVKESQLLVGLTSNGLCAMQRLQQLAAAGLNNLNISLHTIRPDRWCLLQGHNRVDLVRRQIDHVLGNLRQIADEGLTTRANIVVDEDPQMAIEVIDALRGTRVEVRILNALGSTPALASIERVLDHFQARFIGAQFTTNSSQCSRTYTTTCGRIVVKCIRSHQTDSICTGCTEKCLEGVYGVRIESLRGQLHARLCVQHESEHTLLPLDRMPGSPQLNDIVGHLAAV